MRTLIALSLLACAASVPLLAVAGAPEIDPASGASALALLTGAVLVIRGRRKK
jgi:hypothetical protein